jgi:hypothetical protein
MKPKMVTTIANDIQPAARTKHFFNTSSLLVCMFLMLFTACKKDKDDTPTLKGKWTMVNIIEKEYRNGTLTNTETLPGDGMTVDFQNNGKLVVTSNGSVVDSAPYTIKSSNLVDINGMEYEIRNLTNSSVTLFQDHTISSDLKMEVTLNLKR